MKNAILFVANPQIISTFYLAASHKAGALPESVAKWQLEAFYPISLPLPIDTQQRFSNLPANSSKGG